MIGISEPRHLARSHPQERSNGNEGSEPPNKRMKLTSGALAKDPHRSQLMRGVMRAHAILCGMIR
jgi:hypothetical protein